MCIRDREYDAMIENLGERLQEYEKQIAAMKAKIIELEDVYKRQA